MLLRKFGVTLLLLMSAILAKGQTSGVTKTLPGVPPCGTLGNIQIANVSGTALDCDTTISIDKVAHTINVGTLPTNHVLLDAPTISAPWHFNLSSAAIAALALGGGTPGTGKYIDGGTGNWTLLPSPGTGTVTDSGSPAAGDIAAFTSATDITKATATQVNTLIKNLTGCNTATNVYTPQGADCVAPSSGTSGAMTNITGTVTATGCTVSGGACSVSGSTTAVVTFSSIPGTHLHLNVKMVGKTTSGGEHVWVTYNADSTSGHYSWNQPFSSASSGTALSGTGGSASDTHIGGCFFASTVATYCDATINFYTAAFNKQWLAQQTGDNGSGSTPTVAWWDGVWQSTAAITSITMTIEANDFASGAEFIIYAID